MYRISISPAIGSTQMQMNIAAIMSLSPSGYCIVSCASLQKQPSLHATSSGQNVDLLPGINMDTPERQSQQGSCQQAPIRWGNGAGWSQLQGVYGMLAVLVEGSRRYCHQQLAISFLQDHNRPSLRGKLAEQCSTWQGVSVVPEHAWADCC